MTLRLPWLAHTLCSALYLNLLWVAASLAVVTLPAATCALLALMYQWQTHRSTPSARAFVRAMRAVLRSSSLISVLAATVIALATINVAIANQFGSGRRIFLALMFAVLFNGLVLTVFTLPFLAVYGGDVRRCVSGAARLSASSPSYAVAASLIVLATAILVVTFPLTLLGSGVGAAAAIEALRRRAAKRLDHVVPVS